MTLTPELKALAIVTAATSLMWMPYVLARMAVLGIWPTMSSDAALQPLRHAWAERAKRAHANAVEGLAVFAPLVLIAAAVGASSAGTVLAAQGYLAARLVHYAAYVAGVPGLRTVAFLAGWACTLPFIAILLG